MCADQLTRERHKRKAFLNFSEFQCTVWFKKKKSKQNTITVFCVLYNNHSYCTKHINGENRINESGFSHQLRSSHSVLLFLFILVKTKRRSVFHPPTGTSGGRGTATCGRNTRLREWVIYFSREKQDGVYIKWPPAAGQRRTESL